MRPDDPEVRAFLAQSMIARVAALSPKGRPFMTPLWFVCDAGQIHVPTGSGSLAARYLSARPAALLLFDAERSGQTARVLRIRGRATVRPGVAPPRVLVRLLLKYLFSSPSRGLLPYLRKFPLIRRYYAQAEGAVVIEVVPETAEFLPRAAT